MNIEQIIQDYPTKHPLGLTQDEITDVLTNFDNIYLEDIRDNLVHCSIGEHNGNNVYYQKDVTKLIKQVRLKQIIN